MTSQPAISLADLATQINQEHQACEQAVQSAVKHARRAGELLQVAKAQVPHGQWIPWLEANFTGSVRTAQAYMKVAREWPHLAEGANAQRVAHLSYRKALAALAEPRQGPGVGEAIPEGPSATPAPKTAESAGAQWCQHIKAVTGFEADASADALKEGLRRTGLTPIIRMVQAALEDQPSPVPGDDERKEAIRSKLRDLPPDAVEAIWEGVTEKVWREDYLPSLTAIYFWTHDKQACENCQGGDITDWVCMPLPPTLPYTKRNMAELALRTSRRIGTLLRWAIQHQLLSTQGETLKWLPITAETFEGCSCTWCTEHRAVEPGSDENLRNAAIGHIFCGTGRVPAIWIDPPSTSMAS